jgi:acetolactate synthase I/II/III large subunit
LRSKLMVTTVDVIAQTLSRAGVPYLFGYPGGEVVEFMQAAKQTGLPFFLTKHENTAAFAAGVTGEITGIPGVCVSTLGPGVTNMATGIANAWMDRDPVIAITGQIAFNRYSTATHQVMDSIAFFKTFTKWSALVEPDSSFEIMHKAIRIATSERPGPVHLALPSNWATLEAKGMMQATPAVRVYEGMGMPSASSVKHARSMIEKANKPILFAGIGILRSGAGIRLVALAEKLGAPVIVTPKAKGVISEDHPLFAGVFEMLGDRVVIDLSNKADLILACGFDAVELDKPWTFAAPVIHVDTQPNIDEFYHAETELVGNLNDCLVALCEEASCRQAWSYDEIKKHWDALFSLITRKGNGLATHEVVRGVRALLPRETIATCDVGAHKFVTGQLWTTYSPKTFFMSNGLSGMGYGFPAAIAAQLAFPDRPVVAFLGDGGFAMYLAEIETAKRLRLPLIIIVLSDETLSLIAMSQERRGLPHNSVFFKNPDIEKVAKAFGADGRICTTIAEVQNGVETAWQERRLTLIQAVIDPAPYRI